MKYIVDLHIHTYNSYDAVITTKAFIKYFQVFNKYIKKKINDDLIFLVALVDHDNFPRIDLNRIKRVFNEELIIFLGSEISSTVGDIIILNEKNESNKIGNLKSIFKTKDFNKIIAFAKENNFLTILPHPFKRHKNVEKLINRVDIIEIFNGRVLLKNNLKAIKLFLKKSFTASVGSDAHFPKEIFNTFLILDTNQSFSFPDYTTKDLLNILGRAKNKFVMFKKIFFPMESMSQIITAFRKTDMFRIIYSLSTLLKWTYNIQRIYKEQQENSTLYSFNSDWLSIKFVK